MVQVVDAITESGGEVDNVVLVAPDSLDDDTGLIESPVSWYDHAASLWIYLLT